MIKTKRCFFLVIFFLFSSTIFAATTQQRTYTLKQINGTGGLLLQGASTAGILYLPILKQWEVNAVHAHLLIRSADFNNNINTLTAWAGNDPLGSLQITGNTNSSPWDINLTGDSVKGNIINLKFSSIINEFGFDCYNLSNPNFWVYLLPESTITYDLTIKDYEPNLSAFPYPFANEVNVEKDKVLLVYPDQLTFETYTAIFNVANALAHYANWRGIDLISIPISQLKNAEKQNSNIILIGEPQALGLANLGIKLPLPLRGNQFQNANGTIISADQGVLMIAASPWDTTQAALIISGNSPQAVNKAALALRDPAFPHNVLFNQYALINESQLAPIKNREWDEATFKQLGFLPQSVYGSGASHLDYFIELAKDKMANSLELTLKYGVSPFLLANQDSQMTLNFNDIPVNGTPLLVNKNNVNEWRVKIPANVLKTGKNHLALIFNLRLRERKCTPQDNSLSWVTIYSDSKVAVKYNNDKPLLTLSMFNASSHETIFGFSSANIYDYNFLKAWVELAKLMPFEAPVTVMDAASITADRAKAANVFLINPSTNWPEMNQLKPLLPFYYDEKGIVVNPNIRSLVASSNETPIGIIEIIPSPFNSDYHFTFVTAKNAEGYKRSLDLLIDPRKYGYIDNGDAALVYANGTFTSVQANRLERQAMNRGIFEKTGRYVYLGTFVFFGILIFAFILRWIYRKLNYYFSKNPNGNGKA